MAYVRTIFVTAQLPAFVDERRRSVPPRLERSHPKTTDEPGEAAATPPFAQHCTTPSGPALAIWSTCAAVVRWDACMHVTPDD